MRATDFRTQTVMKPGLPQTQAGFCVDTALFADDSPFSHMAESAAAYYFFSFFPRKY